MYMNAEMHKKAGASSKSRMGRGGWVCVGGGGAHVIYKILKSQAKAPLMSPTPQIEGGVEGGRVKDRLLGD